MLTNPILASIALIVIGLASGTGAAAGVFALITKVGILPQIADKTKTYGIASPKAALAFSIYASISSADG